MPVVVAWFACQQLVVVKWWCPARLRLAILRAFGAGLGTGVYIRHDVRIHWPWKLTVGDDCWIGEGAWILNLEPVTLGHDTVISQGAMLCTGSHDRRSASFEFDNAPITVGSSVWVAVRATVLRGVTIGDGATVGAGCVVHRDVAPGALVTVGSGDLDGAPETGDPVRPRP